MNRSKLLLLTIGLIISGQTFSQTNFGVKTGVNISNMGFDIGSDYGTAPDTKAKLGFHIGIIADVPLIENTLSLQPGLIFSNKGYAWDVEEAFNDFGAEITNYKGYLRINYNYIELPLNLVYQSNGLQVFAGPYLAVGLGGSFNHNFSFDADGEGVDSDDLYDESSYRLKPVFGAVDNAVFEDYLNDDDLFDLYRALDFGLNLGVGYQVGSLLFNVAYSFGLSNMTPDYDADDYDLDDAYTENVVQKNKVFTFSVSYFYN